jgi:hypothetical protein
MRYNFGKWNHLQTPRPHTSKFLQQIQLQLENHKQDLSLLLHPVLVKI